MPWKSRTAVTRSRCDTSRACASSLANSSSFSDMRVQNRGTAFLSDSVFRSDLEVQNGGDQIQMRYQQGLCELLGELLVLFGYAGPKSGNGLSQRLRIHLGEMRPNLETFVHLIGFQLADGHAADHPAERVLTQIEVDLRKLHLQSAYHVRDGVRRMGSGYRGAA